MIYSANAIVGKRIWPLQLYMFSVCSSICRLKEKSIKRLLNIHTNWFPIVFNAQLQRLLSPQRWQWQWQWWRPQGSLLQLWRHFNNSFNFNCSNLNFTLLNNLHGHTQMQTHTHRHIGTQAHKRTLEIYVVWKEFWIDNLTAAKMYLTRCIFVYIVCTLYINNNKAYTLTLLKQWRCDMCPKVWVAGGVGRLWAVTMCGIAWLCNRIHCCCCECCVSWPSIICAHNIESS